MNFRLLWMFALVATTLFSCGLNSDGDAAISFLVDGEEQSFSTATGLLAETDSMQFISLSITATTISTDPATMLITILGDLSEGSYTFGQNVTIGYAPNTISEPDQQYEAISGTFTVTSVDQENKTVAGTFSATMGIIPDNSVEIEITEGSFDITYL